MSLSLQRRNKDLKAGMAQTRIQTEIGLDLTGYLVLSRKAKATHDELFVKVLVLDDGKIKTCIVTGDLLALDTHFVRGVCRQIERQTGISRDNIIITTSHTHSGPATVRLRGCGQINQRWLNNLQKDIVVTVCRAKDKTRKAKVGVGSGITREVSINRRMKLPDGRIRMSWEGGFNNPDGIIDPEVGVVKFEDTNGKTIGILANFTCHPVVLKYNNLLISADYPGYMMKEVSNKIKGMVIFTNGACGDIDPKFRGSFKKAEQLGNRLAREVLKVTKRIKTTSQGKLRVKKKMIELPFQLPSLNELRKEIRFHKQVLKKLEAKGAYLNKRKMHQVFLEWAQEKLNIIQNQRPKGVRMEIKVLAINDTVLIAIPAEVFVEIGLAIKKDSPFQQTFIIGYANGCVGYLPTGESCQEGGYEIDTAYKFYNSFPFSPGTGDKVKEAALNLAEEVKEGRAGYDKNVK